MSTTAVTENPYFAPYQGRRPIVERVRECRPLHLTTPYDHAAPVLAGAEAGTYLEIIPENALALCRCAVEDWLMAQSNGGIGLEDEGGKRIWIRCGDLRDFESTMPNQRFSGDRQGALHAVLNRMAHAVADALGIDP